MKTIKLETDPIEKLYAGLARDAEQEVFNYRKPPRRFRASEAADCRRKIWYRLAGFIPEPAPPWLSLVADSGNFHHDYSRKMANHYGVGFSGFTENAEGGLDEEPTTVAPVEYAGRSFDVSARADAGLDLGLRTLATVEIKSMSHFAYDKVSRAFQAGGEEKALDTVNADSPYYIWQGNATALAKGLDFVYLLLVNRSSNRIGLFSGETAKPHEWKPLEGRRSGLVWEVETADKENVMAKFADIDAALEKGSPPQPDYADGATACNQCPFWYACWGAKKKPKAEYPVPGVMK